MGACEAKRLICSVRVTNSAVGLLFANFAIKSHVGVHCFLDQISFVSCIVWLNNEKISENFVCWCKTALLHHYPTKVLLSP
jgi:hypothetical protein